VQATGIRKQLSEAETHRWFGPLFCREGDFQSLWQVKCYLPTVLLRTNGTLCYQRELRVS